MTPSCGRIAIGLRKSARLWLVTNWERCLESLLDWEITPAFIFRVLINKNFRKFY